ncbi:hypothetical protein DFJ73DRAFT_358446 [Zopfochytrium polystomum]|nr:hypothetical protein DFJ73DRAFT_358446 [Zopfochytrium polystomum]
MHLRSVATLLLLLVQHAILPAASSAIPAGASSPDAHHAAAAAEPLSLLTELRLTAGGDRMMALAKAAVSSSDSNDSVPPPPRGLPTNYTTAAVRPVLSTGAPPATSAFGTAIWRGQSAAIRFTAPSDVPPYGALLRQIQITVSSGYRDSNARLYVCEDSGANSPGTVILDSKQVVVRAGWSRITLTALYPGTIYLWPGELFWLVVEGDGYTLRDGFSWLDSANGVAWTAFYPLLPEPELLPDEEQKSFSQDGLLSSSASAPRWIVQRSTSASSSYVLVE